MVSQKKKLEFILAQTKKKSKPRNHIMTSAFKTISGAEFNKLGKTVYKLTVKNNIHNEFEFKEGLNVDYRRWDVSGECCAGGFYATLAEHFYKWLYYTAETMHWRWKVTIPDDALVCVDLENKIKTNKFILSECIPISEMKEWQDQELCKMVIREWYLSAIEFMPNASEELQALAIHEDAIAIMYIKNPSKYIQKLAIQKNYSTIRHIQDPPESLQMLAVGINHSAIKYIENPTPKVLSKVLQFDLNLYKSIEHPSEEVNIFFVQHHPDQIKNVQNPSKQVKIEAIKAFTNMVENL